MLYIYNNISKVPLWLLRVWRHRVVWGLLFNVMRLLCHFVVQFQKKWETPSNNENLFDPSQNQCYFHNQLNGIVQIIFIKVRSWSFVPLDRFFLLGSLRFRALLRFWSLGSLSESSICIGSWTSTSTACLSFPELSFFLKL